MATVWIPAKCPTCKKLVRDGEKAILVAEVKVTKEDAYGSYGTGSGRKLRPNFFNGSTRVLYHLDCLTVTGFNDG